MAALPRCVSVFVDSLRLKKGRYGYQSVSVNPVIRIMAMPSVTIRKAFQAVRVGYGKHCMASGH